MVDDRLPRSRHVGALPVDEQPRRDGSSATLAELRLEVGEAAEPPHLHGIGSLVAIAAREAARRPDVEAHVAITLDRAALRFQGTPSAVGAALTRATAALGDLPSDALAAARADLRGVRGRVTIGSVARWERFGVGGYGSSALPLFGSEGAGDDDVRAWAARWHERSARIVALGALPDDLDHRLPADGPPVVPVPLAPARLLPGTTAWAFDLVGTSWVAGTSLADRAAGVVLADRLRARLVGPGRPAARLDQEAEGLGEAALHVVVALTPDPGREDELAAAAAAELDALAETGPSEVELVALLDRSGGPPGGATGAGSSAAAGGLSPAAVADAARRAREGLLLLLPRTPRAVAGRPVAPWLDQPRLGSPWLVLQPARGRARRGHALELHDGGVRFVSADGNDDVDRGCAVALLRHADGTRVVVTRDGRRRTLDPSDWRRGEVAVEHVDALLRAVAVDVAGAAPA